MIIVGDRGTGKTTFIKGDSSLGIPGRLAIYRRTNPSAKILIVDTFDNPVWREYPILQAHQIRSWKTGTARLFGSDTDFLMQVISTELMNAVLIFEDATKFIPSKLTKPVKNFILDSKQKNLDIWFIFHYLMAVPNDLSRISDWIVLFKTNESWSASLTSKFPNPVIEKAHQRVLQQKSRYAFEMVKISG
jgi:hypothetical protein